MVVHFYIHTSRVLCSGRLKRPDQQSRYALSGLDHKEEVNKI